MSADPQSTEVPAAASPPDPAVEAEQRMPLLAAATDRHRALASLLARAAAGPAGLDDADVVHDLRVASRRMGEVARLLAAFLDAPTAKAVTASLRDLRQAMGHLRDSDVMREHLSHWRMPAPVRAVAAEVADALAARRGELAQAAAKVISSASVQGAVVILARVIEGHFTPATGAAAEKRLHNLITQGLKKRDKQLRRALGKAARKQTAESLHDARVAVKKLRYTSELAAGASIRTPAGGDMKRQVKFLKRLQELLGDHHDAHVILATLESQLHAPRATPLRGLAPAWRKWRTGMQRQQAHRAAIFFMRSYAWMNR